MNSESTPLATFSHYISGTALLPESNVGLVATPSHLIIVIGSLTSAGVKIQLLSLVVLLLLPLILFLIFSPYAPLSTTLSSLGTVSIGIIGGLWYWFFEKPNREQAWAAFMSKDLAKLSQSRMAKSNSPTDISQFTYSPTLGEISLKAPRVVRFRLRVSQSEHGECKLFVDYCQTLGLKVNFL